MSVQGRNGASVHRILITTGAWRNLAPRATNSRARPPGLGRERSGRGADPRCNRGRGLVPAQIGGRDGDARALKAADLTECRPPPCESQAAPGGP